jgi:hypothetical protein
MEIVLTENVNVIADLMDLIVALKFAQMAAVIMEHATKHFVNAMMAGEDLIVH